MLNNDVLALKETECSEVYLQASSVTSITVPNYCTEYLYFITIIIMKSARQIVKVCSLKSQDSLLSTIVLNVIQVQPLVSTLGKDRSVAEGGIFREI